MGACAAIAFVRMRTDKYNVFFSNGMIPQLLRIKSSHNCYGLFHFVYSVNNQNYYGQIQAKLATDQVEPTLLRIEARTEICSLNLMFRNPPAHFPLGNGPEAFRAGYNPDTIYLQSYNPINLKPRERFTSSFILLRRTWFCRLMMVGLPRRAVGSTRKMAKSKKTSVSPARRAFSNQKQASRLHGVHFGVPGASAPTCVLPGRRAILHPKNCEIRNFDVVPMISKMPN